MISRIRFPTKVKIKYNSSMFASRDACINFGKKMCSNVHVDFTFTRS